MNLNLAFDKVQSKSARLILHDSTVFSFLFIFVEKFQYKIGSFTLFMYGKIHAKEPKIRTKCEEKQINPHAYYCLLV